MTMSDATNAAALSAAATVVTGAMDMRRNKKAAKENRAFAREMFNKTNEYNTPLAQRQRLEAAGLNPHLVYGNGSVANTAQQGKVPERQPVKSPDMTGAINTYFQVRQQEQTLENMKKQYEVMNAEIENKKMQTAGTAVSTARTQQQLDQANELFTYTVQGQELKNTNLALKNWQNQEFIRQMPEKHQMLMQEAGSRIMYNMSKLTGQELSNALEAEKLNLRRQGVEVSDSMFWRVFAPIINPVKSGIQGVSNSVKQLGDYVDSIKKSKY